MLGKHLTPMSERSDSERAEIIEKAQQARKDKAQWAKENLKLDWEDEDHWRELSKKHGYRLPTRNQKAAGKFVNRFLKHFNLDKEWYQDYSGFKNGNEEARVNPKLPAFAMVGLLLEQYDEDVSK